MYLCYLNHSLLFESRFVSNFETLNEVIFLVLCYHLVLLANIVQDFDVRELIGKSFIVVSIVLVAVNLVVILGANVMVLS